MSNTTTIVLSLEYCYSEETAIIMHQSIGREVGYGSIVGTLRSFRTLEFRQPYSLYESILEVSVEKLNKYMQNADSLRHELRNIQLKYNAKFLRSWTPSCIKITGFGINNSTTIETMPGRLITYPNGRTEFSTTPHELQYKPPIEPKKIAAFTLPKDFLKLNFTRFEMPVAEIYQYNPLTAKSERTYAETKMRLDKER